MAGKPAAVSVRAEEGPTSVSVALTPVPAARPGLTRTTPVRYGGFGNTSGADDETDGTDEDETDEEDEVADKFADK